MCEESVVSCYSPQNKHKVYCQKCWLSDKWDFENYGKDYDFSKPFFEQWYELFLKIPHVAINNSNSINSEWVNQESDDKNCYLNVGGHYNEDSAYNSFELFGKNCFDNYWILNSDHCSNNIHGEKNYFVNFSEECHDCLNVNFSYDCRNCSDCLGCAGLRNRKNCIFNKQYTKEEYNEFLKEHPFSLNSGILWWMKESKKVWLAFPHRNSMIFKSINSTGNDLSEAKDSHNCFQCTRIENSKNLYITGWMKDCYDCSNFGAAELAYECAHSGGAYNSKSLICCLSNDPLKKVTINNAEYCAMSNSISNCFGCVGLRNKDYMILNKRYSKEEYNELLPKIKQHMLDMPYLDKNGKIYIYGDFFPSQFSPFGYNETTAEDYIKLEEKDATQKGFNWNNYVSDTNYTFSDYIIPDDIKDVGDDILEKILRCEKTGKAYKIIQMELSFYRQVGLPVPRICYKSRYKEKISRLLPIRLFERNCDKCKIEIKTSYAPDRPEIVYCEKCYQQEVY